MRYNRKGTKIFCSVCYKYVGDYETGQSIYGHKSYYSLIRTKYCRECAETIKKQQINFCKHNNNKGRKLVINELLEQVEMLQKQNLALRELLMDNRRV